MEQHQTLYAAFDRFPSPKGAATHIQHMISVLFDYFEDGLLCVLGSEDLPRYQHEGSLEVVRFCEPQLDFWERVATWSAWIHQILEQQPQLKLCHFRDPWSALPILEFPQRQYQTIYEINGLPSIELPSHNRSLAPAQIRHLRAVEERCWHAADVLISPSQTMRECLIKLGAPAAKLVVIPNGATIVDTIDRPATTQSSYILYFGALQAWQGIDVLLRAWAELRDWPDLELVICSATSEKRARPYQQLADRLGCAQRTRWLFELSKPELEAWKQHALFSVAPLTQCERNLDQGCCPFKILESMAAAVPVIASDLPVVREIITHAHDGWLVRPDRPADLARAMRVLLEYPEQRRQLGLQAQTTIKTDWTWEHSSQLLRNLYTNLCPDPRSAL